jgi:hypothetical protein
MKRREYILTLKDHPILIQRRKDGFCCGKQLYLQRSRSSFQFASLFCIIIYCYSLIYFIFRINTYVISFVSTCLMIIGGVAVGVRILLKKGPSRDHILKIRKIPEKYQEIIFSQKTHEARRRSQEEPGGPHTLGWRGQPPGRASPV